MCTENILFVNLLLIILWHLIVLFLCMHLNPCFFNPERSIYSIRSWETDGNFYINILKIKKWKDKLPQFVTKNGFSKRSLNKRLNREYIERFMFETCRAEWNHFMCCMYFIISFFINTWVNAIIFSVVPIVVNLPFLFIQRFNRIRLYKLLNKKHVVAADMKVS